MSQFTIGCDPEVFVKEKASGKIVTAHGLIPGDKQNPHKVSWGAIQVDGMALEFNIDPVSLDAYSGYTLWETYLMNVMKQLKAAIPDHRLVLKSAHQFDKDYYDNQVPEEAKVLGCDPDFNAWEDGAENPAPDGSSGLRTAAGHIHIGWGRDIPIDHPDHIAICCRAVKALDFFVGLPMAYLDPDPTRRQMYGKAGAFRPKPYGVEYRTPSNMWLKNKKTRKAIYDLTGAAVSFLKRGDVGAPDYIRTMIDNGSKEEVKGALLVSGRPEHARFLREFDDA
jgi:hypothetical protein